MNPEQALARVTSRPGARPPAVRGDSAPVQVRARLQLLVMDEEGIMREALCRLLSDLPNVALVSSASIGVEALRSASSLRPDIVVFEFPPTPHAGARMIAALKGDRAVARVIVLTSHGEAEYINAALRAGADGYLLKSDSRLELLEAFTSVIAGTRYVSAAAAARARANLADGRGRRDAQSPDLTARERQVIRLIASGHRTREIAQVLSLSHKTIEKHRTSLMRKLGLRNASAVAAYAIAHGFG